MTVSRESLVMGALFAFALALYSLTAAQVVLGGDNGEFATLAVTGGVAHPPGYPLYVAYLRLLSWLPAASPAHAAALANAIVAALAVVAVYLAALSYGGAVLSSAAAALLFAVTPWAWRQATQAEVFSLNALLAATLLACCGPQAKLSAVAQARSLGFLFGLGFCHHHTLVFMLPVAIVALRKNGQWRSVMLGFTFGLLPLLYGLAASDAGFWGGLHTLGDWLRLWLRSDYGAFASNAASGRQPLEQLALFASAMVNDATLPLFLLGLGATFVSRRLWPVTLCLLLSGPVFLSLLSLPPSGLGRMVVQRFYLLPLVCAAVMAGAVLGEIGIGRAWSKRLTLALFGLCLPLGVLSVLRVRTEHSATLQNYFSDTLAVLPKGAILFGTSDLTLFGFSYMQKALHQRTDVTYVHLPLWANAWYRARVAPFLPAGRHDDVAQAALATGRPVFATRPLSRTMPSYPLGTVVRLVALDQDTLKPSQLDAQNTALGEQFKVQHADLNERDDTWNALALDAYARPWLTLANVYGQMGDIDNMTRCRDKARTYTPWLR